MFHYTIDFDENGFGGDIQISLHVPELRAALAARLSPEAARLALLGAISALEDDDARRQLQSTRDQPVPEAGGDDGDTHAGSEPAGVQAASDNSKPKASRRRQAAKAAPEDDAGETAEPEAPASEETKPVSRRRKKAADAKPEQEPDAKPEQEPEQEPEKPASRRRSKKTEPAEADETLTDLELTKRAAIVAVNINPAAVHELLDEFGVERVQDLPQESRREFMDRLEAL